ncbi:MAG: B12-binding domain-containing radical SAM protein, partial [Desulfobacterales bacterium]|nr:B12-binding domain-containing radical SAM protein [Desulfobacterales bacterium]
KAGLETHLTMMAGYPWETRRQARRTVAFARRLMERGYAAMLQATVIVPYPGTPLYAEAVERDWFLIDPTDYAGLDMSRPVLKTPDMSPEEVLALCGEIYRSFLSPGYLGRQLLSIRNWSDINYYLRGLRPVWGHLRDFSRRRSTC